jgi:exonuclease SbcD
MGFGEATQTKCVYLIDFTITKQIDTIPIPVFQKLETIIGDKAYIEHRLNQLKESNESVWVEINYKSDLLFPNLSVWIAEQTKDSLIEVLKLQNKRGLTELLFAYEDADSLDELNEFEVFEKLLHKEAFSDEQIDLLKETYQEIVSELKIGE